MWRPRCWRWPGCPSRPASTASSSCPCTGSAWRTRSTTPAPPSGTRPSTSRCAANRGIYHKGWTAVTRHSTPWEFGAELPAFDDDVWELYDPTPTGPRPTTWPPPSPTSCMSCSGCSCWKPASTTCSRWTTAGWSGSTPTWPAGPSSSRGNRQLLFGGMGRLTENSVVNLKNKSHAVTAQIVVPDSGAQGVLIAQGGAFGGWSLYATETAGRPTATTCSGCNASRSPATGRSRPASTRCGWSSPTTAAGWPRAAPSPCTSTASKVGEGRVEGTQPMLFSPDETTDVGSDSATPVSDDYGPKDQRLHRPGALGRDRPGRRRRRPGPSHHAGGAAADRHGPPVSAVDVDAGRPARAARAGHLRGREAAPGDRALLVADGAAGAGRTGPRVGHHGGRPQHRPDSDLPCPVLDDRRAHHAPVRPGHPSTSWVSAGIGGGHRGGRGGGAGAA